MKRSRYTEELEDENAQLKKLLAESMMDVSTLRETLGKNF
jgi:putative transposase